MMADDLVGRLAQEGITGLKSFQAGAENRTKCPFCPDGGSKQDGDSLTVTIDGDGLGATWQCWRKSKCGRTGGFRISDRPAYERQSGTAKPRNFRPPPDNRDKSKPVWMYRFFAERKIGGKTVDDFGIFATRRNFPKPIGNDEAIVFPYVWEGIARNHKYRSRTQKTPQMQDPGALPTLFNADVIKKAKDGTLYWVEGEPDVMAMHEMQHPLTVSLKDGAPSEATFRPDDNRFAALATHAKELAEVKRFVIATDMDRAGLALREELCRRLGRHKCLTVDWPQGCKDACDALKLGWDEAQAAINGAKQYPIEGIYEVTGNVLVDLFNRKQPRTFRTGTSSTDAILRLPEEGRLIVVTGFANHGKTTWTRFIVVESAERSERRWGVFSPEHQPWESFAAEVAQVYAGKPFWPVLGLDTMSIDEMRAAGDWMSQRIKMIVCDSADEAPTIDWLLERATSMVLTFGMTDLLLDPWNEIEHVRGDLSETDYTARSLQRLKAWALRYGCNVWLVAHPAKPLPMKRDAPPGGYEISGSAHWSNKTDLGLTIWSSEDGRAELHVWKSRFRRWAKRGNKAVMDFDELSCRYRDPITQLSTDEPAMPSWMDDR